MDQYSSSSHSLAIESFSNSWLTYSPPSFLDSLETSPSVRPSVDGFHDFNNSCRELRSRTCVQEESHKFYFDLPPVSSSAIAPADQLFSDGLIKPTASSSFTKSHTTNPSLSPDSTPPPSSSKRAAVVATVNIQCQVFGRWRKLSTRVLVKCFRRMKRSFVVRSSRKSVRVDDVGIRRALQVRSLTNSPSSTTYSTDGNWSDMDSSIYEAVLHCKRSIGK